MFGISKVNSTKTTKRLCYSSVTVLYLPNEKINFILYYFTHNVSEFVGLRLTELPYFENDLTKVMDDTHTFDLHIGVSGNHTYPNDYEMIKIGKFVQIKKIHMKDGIPYCFNVRLKKFIRFNLLHFQGGNKQIMRHFYVAKS